MPYKVGVSTGLYTVARSEELSDLLKKFGFAMTRGTNVIEMTADIPHEVNITDGLALMHMAEKQGVELTFHGSLTVPLEIPERVEWRDAQDHMEKSVRSAVFAGCKYVNFHACLNIWLELMTYAGRKLSMVFCDHEGNFISKIMKECEPLRKWFVENRWEEYYRSALSEDEINGSSQRAHIEVEAIIRGKTEDLAAKLRRGEITTDEYHKQLKQISDEESRKMANLVRENIRDALTAKLAKDGRWDTESIRGMVEVIDGYRIIAHYLFFTKDSIWIDMARMYGIKPEYDNPKWLDDAWYKAEKNNDRKFKEFFYAACGAKFLEGHCKKLFEWMKKDLVKEIEAVKLPKEAEKDREKILKTAKDINIVFESPDARDPSHAGLFILWSPRQMYAAIKNVRSNLKTERIWMLMDFEHVATQGIDPIQDMKSVVKIAPDFGRYVFSMHCNPPNPLHAMDPIELGNTSVYELLWLLRTTGFGKERPVYLIFERGGAKDPFERSVEVLKLCVKYLEMDMPPDKLPPEFFGVEGPTAGSIVRQGQIVKDHAWEPLKDLMEMPEEEWTFLSQTAIRKGKRPEVWKRAEFR
jgi:hypothetical protein